MLYLLDNEGLARERAAAWLQQAEHARLVRLAREYRAESSRQTVTLPTPIQRPQRPRLLLLVRQLRAACGRLWGALDWGTLARRDRSSFQP